MMLYSAILHLCCSEISFSMPGGGVGMGLAAQGWRALGCCRRRLHDSGVSFPTPSHLVGRLGSVRCPAFLDHSPGQCG